MILPETRHLVRPLTGSLVLALVFGTGVVLQVRGHAGTAHAQVADPSRAQVILDWFAARNRGDAQAAADMFAVSALYIGSASTGQCSAQTPCYDRASVLQNMQTLASTQQPCLTVTGIEVNGSIVTGRVELRNNDTRRVGIERVLRAFLADVRDGQIYSLYAPADSADPLTALNAAIAAGRVQPGTPISAPATCG